MSELRNTEFNNDHIDENYSVYLFFKDHLAFFVACVTGFLAFGTTVIRTFLYTVEKRYYAYWRIDELVTGKDYQDIASVMPSVVNSIMVVIIVLVLTRSSVLLFQGIITSNKLVDSLKIELTELMKSKREDYKTACLTIVRAKWFLCLHKNGTAVNEMEKILCDASRLRERFIEDICQLKKHKREIRRIKREYRGVFVRKFIIHFLMCGFLYVFFYMFYFGTFPSTGWVLLTALIVLILILVLPLLFTLIDYLIKGGKLITCKCEEGKNEKKEERETELNYSESIEMIKKNLFPIDMVIHQGLISFVSNSILKKAVINLLVVFIATTISLHMGLVSRCGGRREFPIVSINEKTYFLVYVDSGQAVLDECEIKNDTITVNTRKKRVVNLSDLIVDNMLFKEVIRL